MCRSVQQIQQVILLGQQLINLSLQSRQIEFIVFVQHLIGSEFAAHIVAQHLVSAPIPVGAQSSLALVQIVPNSMVNSAGTTSGSYSSNITFRAGVAKGSGQHAVQIFRQATDGCISNQFVGLQATIYLFHSGQAHELFILVQNSADGSVSYGVLAVFSSSCYRSSVSTKNFVLGSLALCMFCSNTHYHNICLLALIYSLYASLYKGRGTALAVEEFPPLT